MIVSNQQIQMMLRQYGVRQAKGVEEQRPTCASGTESKDVDRAEFSGEAQIYRRAREAALQAPDVREERVQEIRTALKNDRYSVPAEDVAGKILERLIIDRLV